MAFDDLSALFITGTLKPSSRAAQAVPRPNRSSSRNQISLIVG
jgi:hypothetical protein